MKKFKTIHPYFQGKYRLLPKAFLGIFGAFTLNNLPFQSISLKNTVIYLPFLICLLLTNAMAQKEVNQSCTNDDECKSKICLKLRDGHTKKCGTCEQEVFDDLAPKVDENCKSIGQGWTPRGSTKYQESKADDGRVYYNIFEDLLVKAEDCRNARLKLMKECFGGGDDKHKKELGYVEDAIENVFKQAKNHSNAKNYYYCSKSDYNNKLRSFRDKCPRVFGEDRNKFAEIDQDLNIKNNELIAGKKVDCDRIEDYMEDCEECFEAAEELLDDGFENDTKKFPSSYGQFLKSSITTFDKAEALLKKLKDKNLCD